MFRISYLAEKCEKVDPGAVERLKELALDDSPTVEEVVCRVDEVPEGTKKEVELCGRKILIINDRGLLSAINGLCPHYNYPLLNGTVSNGRLRCPLHGACINLSSGDIEDFPAFDSVHSYPIRIVDGSIVIKTTKKRLGSDRRTRHSFIEETNEEKPIIIVGGGPTGQSLADNLRLAGCKTPIIILTSESTKPYDRVLLSKAMHMDAVRLRTDEYYAENKIDVQINTKVVSLDSATHTIRLDNGRRMEYSKLVLATGGKARKLPNPGGGLKGVYSLRTHSDAKSIWKQCEGKDVVCIGASFIGMEAAASVLGRASSVTVICSTPEPLAALGGDIGGSFRKWFAEKGIVIRPSSRVSEIIGDANGRVSSVLLGDGSRLPAGVVIAGIGIDPGTQWMASGGVRLDSRGFVEVNDRFETNLPDVLAIGDVSAPPLDFWSLAHHNIQHFQTAQKHGQLAAWSMMGRSPPGRVVPLFWTAFFHERGCIFSGCAEGSDSTIVHGDVDGFNYTKYWIKSDRVVAVAVNGGKPGAVQFSALCQQGIRISREDVEKNKTDTWAHLLAP